MTAVVIPEALCKYLQVSRGTKMPKEKLLSLIEDKLDECADEVESIPKPPPKLTKTAPSVSLSDKKKWKLSPELCNFFGMYPGTMMTHQEALSRTIRYIKSRKQLIRPDDFTRFNIDERLRGILHETLEPSFTNLKHHLQFHYTDPDEKKMSVPRIEDDDDEQTIMDDYGRTFTFMRPVVEMVKLSDALADLLEVERGTIMRRDEASNRVISYIKFRELDVRPERFLIEPDHALRRVLEPKLPGATEFSFLNLQAHLVKHFTVMTPEDIKAEKQKRAAAAAEEERKAREKEGEEQNEAEENEQVPTDEITEQKSSKNVCQDLEDDD